MEFEEGKEYLLNFSLKFKDEQTLFPAGFEVAKEQFMIGHKVIINRINIQRLPGLAIDKTKDKVVIVGQGFEVGFNTNTGFLNKYISFT